MTTQRAASFFFLDVELAGRVKFSVRVEPSSIGAALTFRPHRACRYRAVPRASTSARGAGSQHRAPSYRSTEADFKRAIDEYKKVAGRGAEKFTAKSL